MFFRHGYQGREIAEIANGIFLADSLATAVKTIASVGKTQVAPERDPSLYPMDNIE
jgi:hypothetical protein